MVTFSPIRIAFQRLLLLIASSVVCSCYPQYSPGPDKQFEGTVSGAATGAGAGAVTGFQFASASGPGALVGAGIGAISGAIQGASGDLTEEQQYQLNQKIYREQQVAYAQNVLSEHYRRRAELHPSRDIFPADLFFYGDEVKIRPEAIAVLNELAKLNKNRLPFSRLAIAVYAKANDNDSSYAQHLTERRARELVDYFVRAGLEPRRLSTRPVVVSAPVLVDPHDKPERYAQAVEFIAVDR